MSRCIWNDHRRNASKRIYTLASIMKLSLKITAVLIAAIAFWLSIGVEVFHGEHGETSYEPFIKKKLTPIVFVQNTSTCGECDFRPLEYINDESRADFENFCSIRRGIDDITECHAILFEENRAATARFSRNIR